jgi:hypothetical protein
MTSQTFCGFARFELAEETARRAGFDGVFVYHGTFTMAAPALDQLLTRLEAAQRRVGEIRPARGRKAFLAEVSRGRDR